MAFKRSEPAPTPAAVGTAPLPVKIVVAGGFAVGKTTFVGSISEIEPLTTEAVMTAVAEEIDRTGDATDKKTTTVAMDFGRISLGTDLILYLFGTPGQDRFRFLWDELVRGAIGAVVLVDTNRLEDCFPAVDYFENSDVPFVVAVNAFNGRIAHDLGDLREALSISADVPIFATDARSREATKVALVELVRHAMMRASR